MAEKTFTYADRVEVWDGNNLISITPIERPDEPDEPDKPNRQFICSFAHPVQR